ncbi:MAG: sigma-70 family RNA polymerase sigma factor [Planctomycetes bacterium]|nr:sigma-70 family RNA polymerase sigma factor [Planctomycetota bacterium]
MATVDDPRTAPASLDTPALVTLLYRELRAIARRRLAAERHAHSWQPTVLTHEAVERLLRDSGSTSWDCPGHFVAAASRTMRRLLVDAARKRRSERAGGGLTRHDIALGEVAADDPWAETLVIDDLLDHLAASSPSAALVFELRHYCRLTVRETAAALGLAPRTVDRRWDYACEWLLRELDIADRPADAGTTEARRHPR